METFFMGEPGWRRTVYAWMGGELTSTPWLQAGLAPLWLGTWLYGGLLWGHTVSYRWDWRQRKRLPCRVVSIGNITVGGTGKTPLAMWVARWYQQQGWRVAILSRGYGARRRGGVQVVSTGSGPLLDWRLVGDEPYLLAQALPDIPVLIGKDRYLSGRYAWDYFAAQVLVLDDGFQHYALHRDLDIVLLDASRPFGCGALLPRGILREPLSALRRAHAVVLTRVEMAATTLPALRQQVEYWVEAPSILAMTTVAEGVWQKDHRQLDEATRLSGCRVVAFAGIGNPRAFATTLQQLGSEIAALVLFPDHYPYTLYDWQVIVDIARQQQATCLVTTEKDAVRLAPSWHAAIPVYALRIGVRWLQGETFFQQQLAAVMAHA